MTRRYVVVAVVLALCSILGRGETAGDSTAGTPGWVPGEVLLRFREDAPSQPPGLPGIRSYVSYEPSLRVWRAKLEDGLEVPEAVARLRTEPRVQLVQPRFVYVQAAAPLDPLYGTAQHPYLRTINMEAAWDVTTGSRDVIVAVLDGGVDIGHPELQHAIWTNGAEAANGLDDDANGCVDDLHGCNLQADPPNGDIADTDAHGTFISGIIAAAWDGQGSAGVAPGVTIMPVRVLGLDEEGRPGVGTSEQLAAGILYAARQGADIENLSLTKPPDDDEECPPDPLAEETIRQVHDDLGVTVITVSGNFDVGCVGSPGSSPYTIAVGASGGDDRRSHVFDTDTHAPFSQWGPEVDIAAPGVHITSTCPTAEVPVSPFCPQAGYGLGDGTSFATPIVAGVAALLLSASPGLTPDEVRERLRATARDVPDDGRINWDGAGIVDAGAALGQPAASVRLDLRAEDPSALDVALLVGETAQPECRQELWSRAEGTTRRIAASLAAGACAAFWPPSEQRPWSLALDYGGPKSAVLDGWAAAGPAGSCTGEDVPLRVPPGRTIVSLDACPDLPLVLNDEASGAAVVPSARLPASLFAELKYATASPDDPAPSCMPAFSRSAWYSLASPPAGRLAVDTFGSEFDTVLAAYRVDGADLEEVACNGVFSGSQSRLLLDADGTSGYLVMAAALEDVPAGALRVNFSPVQVPANDDQPGAPPLAPGAALAQPAHNATRSPGDPEAACVPQGYGASLWYSITAPEAGPLTLDTEGSGYDTVLAVFRQDGGALVPVACNDDAQTGMRTSLLTWDAAAGQEYVIVAGSFADRPAGALHLRLSGAP